MRIPLSLLVLLTACAPSADGVDTSNGVEDDARAPIPSMGGQSGSEDILVCHEASRVPVTDPAVTPTGATRTADVHLATLRETWEATLDGGESLTLTLTPDASTLEFVVYADENWESGDPVPYGIDDGCEDRYEVDVVLSASAPTLLDERIATKAFGRADDDWLDVYAGVWDEDVVGSTTPAAFDLSTAPNPWLFLHFSKYSSEARLDVHWVSDLDEEDTSEAVYDEVARVVVTAR